ncbi:MAG: hypothetical protein M1820_002778 [Bogoriella megaspora]|nr:MAG: hypothetical protein M1820_002778 [Bogoriella megaspora]
MLSKANSPTARLLRSSRLFSLPPQLPKTGIEPEQAGLDSNLIRFSDSATHPYPVSQSIATPSSSQARGDWGLKRPLPLRTTAHSSNASLRVSSIDSLEHITDFESASDHTKTLEKWQEIGLPVSQLTKRRFIAPNMESSAPVGVFESKTDNTAKSPIPPPMQIKEVYEHQRWKFEGPWIQEMTDADFSKYVTSVGKKRKSRFIDFLWQRERQRALEAEKQQALEDGRVLPADLDKTFNISEESFQDKLKRLRHEMIDKHGGVKVNTELARAMREFLDLPSRTTKSLQNTQNSSDLGVTDDSQQSSPRIHPSAGLSFLRSKAHLPNNPLLGPMNPERTVQARILRGGTGPTIGSTAQRIGLAGVVTDTTINIEKEKSYHASGDVRTPGGPKAWARVDRVAINSQARIEVTTSTPDADAVEIANGRVPQRQQAVPYKKMTAATPFKAWEAPGTDQRGPSRIYGNHDDSLSQLNRILGEHKQTRVDPSRSSNGLFQS